MELPNRTSGHKYGELLTHELGHWNSCLRKAGGSAGTVDSIQGHLLNSHGWSMEHPQSCPFKRHNKAPARVPGPGNKGRPELRSRGCNFV